MITSLKHCLGEGYNPYNNLAVEEYLTFHVEPGECILYLWQNENTVVIGKNQNAYRECQVTKLEEAHGRIARRLSGGGAVYHDLGNLNFTFCVRKDEYDLDRQLSVILAAVQSFGLKAERTGRNDITIDGKKFSGNAFFSSGEYAYNHGTLMIQVNEKKLGDFLTVSKEKLQSKGVDSVRSRVVNLGELNKEITVETMKLALIRAFEQTFGIKSKLWEPTMIEWAQIQMGKKRFESEEWRFGRKIPMTVEFGQRFSFGEVQVQLQVEEGKIANANVYSDALDVEFPKEVEKILVEMPYRKSEFTKVTKNASGPVQEVLQWLEESC